MAKQGCKTLLVIFSCAAQDEYDIDYQIILTSNSFKKRIQ